MSTPLLPADPPAVGPYRVTARLGAGGMGRVFLAVTPDGRQVAVKVIRPEFADDAAYRRRFAQEAAAAARIGAPGIARVLAADPDGPLPYLVTEYVPGPTLAEHVERDGPLRGDALARFAAGVAGALAAVHAAGIVHRDLKPANVVLSPDGPRVVDFGIARAQDASTRHTQTGVLVGSVGWMAPEVLRQAPVTSAVDIFAWGALVAYAGTGRRPFGDGPDVAVAHRVLAGPGPDLAGLPPRLAALAAAALAQDPAARPPAAGLAASLGAPAGVTAPTVRLAAPPPPATRPAVRPAPTRVDPRGASSVPPPTGAPPPRGRRRPRRWPWVLVGVVAGALLVGAFAPKAPSAGRSTPRAGSTASPRPATSAARPSGRPETSLPTAPPQRPADAGVLVADALAPVRDVDMVFRISDLRCGLTSIGSGASAYDLDPGQEACTAAVTVRNVGDVPHAAGVQYLQDARGRAYGSNGFRTGALDLPALELHRLQPGEQLRSGLVWEVAPGFRPVLVVVHGDLITLGTRRRVE